MIKRKLKYIAISGFIFAAAIFAHTLISNKKIVAEANASSTVVGELWNGSSFDNDNLADLATKAGYSSINEMVTAAKGGAIKNAAQLANGNEWSVTLGGLVFNPMYLSKDDDGNAILTLWRASTDAELSPWSDGTYSTDATGKQFNGSTIYSNTYDGSYIHNYVLNGRSTYTTNWGEGTSQSANSTLMNKYAPLRASNGIGNYLVTPSKVNWQTSVPTSWKNDPTYNGTTYGTIANYPCNWMNDKLWLPSIYETYDKTSTNTATLTKNNGLWNTSAAQRSNSVNYWLRSSYIANFYSAYTLDTSGDEFGVSVINSRAVRPALHLNLSAIGSCSHANVDHAEAKAATCSATGNLEYWYCSNCQTYFSDNAFTTATTLSALTIAIDSSAHNYSTEWSKDSSGHWHICTYNSAHKNDEAAHSWGDWVRVDDNTHKRVCTVCGYEQTGVSHNWGGWVNDGTENHKKTCADCGAEKTASHSWGAFENLNDDKHKQTCADCSAVKESNHDYGDWTADGATGHKHVCTQCSNAQTVAHTPVTDAAVEATCLTGGKTEGSHCSVCNFIITAQTDTPALEHSFTNYLSNSDATCTADGTKTAQCDRCTQTDTVPDVGSMLPHDFSGAWLNNETNHWKKCANCTATEQSAAHTYDGDVCSVCAYERDHIHNIVNHAAQSPTCTEVGWNAYETCSACSYSTYVEIPALGHTAGDWITTQVPTCTVAGSKHKLCTVCNTETEVEEIAATGHTAGGWAETLAPTCTVAGSKHRLCTVCSEETEVEAIPALGHTAGDWIVDAPATHDNNGSQHKACTVCGEMIETESIPAIPRTKLVLEVTAGGEHDGEPKPATVKFIMEGEACDFEDFTITYYNNSGTALEGAPADYGEYKVKVTVTNDDFEIEGADEFEFLITKKVEDESGNGSIELPTDKPFKFMVTTGELSETIEGLNGTSVGYEAKLWELDENGEPGESEYKGAVKCKLTFKIPEQLENNRFTIYKEVEGVRTAIPYMISADGKSVVIDYDDIFSAKIIFNAEGVTPEPAPPATPDNSAHWGIWLVVGLAAAILITSVIIIVIIVKKKNTDVDRRRP